MKPMLDGLARLESLEEKVADIAALSDLERKRALIDLRRQYAENLASLSQAIRSSPYLAARNDLAVEFSRRISAVRSAAALHQAEWPAVNSDAKISEYVQSAKNLSRANSDFCRWGRETLKSIR